MSVLPTTSFLSHDFDDRRFHLDNDSLLISSSTYDRIRRAFLADDWYDTARFRDGDHNGGRKQQLCHRLEQRVG